MGRVECWRPHWAEILLIPQLCAETSHVADTALRKSQPFQPHNNLANYYYPRFTDQEAKHTECK